MTSVLASILGATGLGVAFTLAWWLRSALNDRNAEADKRRDSERRADQYQTERDLAVAQLAAAREELVTTRQRLFVDDKQRNDALTKETDAVRNEIQTAPDPGDALNRQLLGTDLPARTAGPAADGAGSGQPDAVKPISADARSSTPSPAPRQNDTLSPAEEGPFAKAT